MVTLYSMHSQDSPFFVAEVSANHNGDKNRALAIIEAAADAGADAVKFQTYKPETMTLDLDEFTVSSDHELWGERKLFDLYAEAQTPWEWHQELFSFAIKKGLIPFSSPFDLSAVEFLESLDCPIYKIASLESSDHRLIKAVAETGKPIIASTGATLLEEIEDLVNLVHSTGNKNLTLLVCTSSYPADPAEANLNRITTLREKFGVAVGVSDHTLGIGVALGALALGATVVEKHLTLSRNDKGADSAFSLEPHEFAMLVAEGKSTVASLGVPDWRISPSETESRRLRRSLYIVQDVRAGDLVSEENLRAIRPGAGLSPKHFDELIGREYKKDFKAGTPITWESV